MQTSDEEVKEISMVTVTQEREAKRRLVLHYMDDIVYEYLLSAGVAAKSADVAAALEAEGVKVDIKFIRLSLSDSSRFIVEDRRWNIGLRGEIRRPFSGLVEFAIHEYGKPMPVDALLNEMALVMRRPLEFFDELLPNALRDEQRYFRLQSGDWGLTEWLLDTRFESEDEIFLRNFFFSQTEAREALDVLLNAPVDAKQSVEDMVTALLTSLEQPINHRLLSFGLWKLRKGSLDSRTLFESLLANENMFLLSSGEWALKAWETEWVAELKKLSKKAEKLDDLPWLEEEPEERSFTVSDQDIKETVSLVKKQHRAARMKEILERIFEIPSGSSRWESAAIAVSDALGKDGRLQRVGAQSWTIPAYIPKVDKLPKALLVEERPRAEDETDAELEDEGLEPGLAAWVHDPRYEEIGEEEEVEFSGDLQSFDEERYVALYHHIKAGTLKLRKADLHFFPAEADPACLMFHDNEDATTEVEAWVSRDIGLIFGLDAWYEERQIQPGAIFTLTRGAEPDDYQIQFVGEEDPQLTISPERQKILRSLKKEAAEKDWPAFEIMCRIMADYDKGIPFMTLWAEANVVRRILKRVVGSNLSSYHCFSQRPAGNDNWVFDERRVSLGRKKTKRHFVRTEEQ
jgi:hypothetical protein